jgi:hypothetical protein
MIMHPIRYNDWLKYTCCVGNYWLGRMHDGEVRSPNYVKKVKILLDWKIL